MLRVALFNQNFIVKQFSYANEDDLAAKKNNIVVKSGNFTHADAKTLAEVIKNRFWTDNIEKNRHRDILTEIVVENENGSDEKLPEYTFSMLEVI